MKPLVIFVIMILLVLVACESENSMMKNNSKTNSESTKKEETVKTNDPIFYSGSSFGNYFQELFQQGLFDEMVELTDWNSRATLGDSIIKNFYRNIDFAFDMKLKSKVKEGNIVWLNYDAMVNMTKKSIRFPIVNENDSCKVDFKLFQISLKNI